ncbi:hypothetical protein [Micromonospora sp. NBC_01796]|uniref:hypothetical protein n=1 Tax=Micromonospora sp. NBC_01796 TaxID=2975987 RepID=UPI002DD8947C|nr:hypothetical protein [Micromonospora sp. NBC_01796]WSA85544.1 hypothetical protein OIE47_35215 [Micromonospora sp. NBC_01796]
MKTELERLEKSHREVSEELLIARQRLAIIRLIIEHPKRLAESVNSVPGMVRLALNCGPQSLAMLIRESERAERAAKDAT